jgi:hypothetical protein
MNAPRFSSRLRQQGMVIAMAVIFLIAAVIFALSQTLGITGSNSIDNAQQLDSTAALFLAESGVERGQSILLSGSSITSTTCNSDIAGSYPLGRGTVTLSGTSVAKGADPNVPCGDSPLPACIKCIIQATGNVVTGNVVSASRTLNFNQSMSSSSGVAGFGTKVSMKLKNVYNVPAVALFNLVWRRQGGTAGETVAGGNADATMCTGLPAGTCTLRWHDESSSGLPSGGSMGVAAQIGPKPASYPVTQTISTNRNFAEVGVLFGSLSGAAGTPTVVGSYWNDASGGGGTGTKTFNNSNATPSQGQTNSGVVAAVSGICTTPDPNSTGTNQTCNSWCYGGDTLVFGVSGRSDSFADQITAVTFNDNGSPSQNLALTPVAHFPNVDGSTPSATGDVYTEIWYAYNANSLSAGNAASSGGVTGAIGANVTGSIGANIKATTTSGSTSVTGVTLTSGTPLPLNVGDVIGGCIANDTIAVVINNTTYTLSANASASNNNKACTVASTKLNVSTVTAGTGLLENNAVISGAGITPGTSITSFVAGAVGGAGNYNLSGIAQGPRGSQTVTSTSNILTASLPTAGPLYVGDVIFGTGVTAGTSIFSFGPGTTGGAGTYNLSGAAQHVDPGTVINTSTITLASGTIDLVSGPGTIVTVRSGTGQFAAGAVSATCLNGGTCVSTVTSTTHFAVSPAPTIPLNGAVICGGTCAFFDNPSSPASNTQFTVTRTGGTRQWAGGFACLGGVDKTKISVVTDVSTIGSSWTEVVK